MSNPRWRIYYDDGSTVSPCDDSSLPPMARGDGVIAIVQADDTPRDPYAVGRELLFDADYYCWRGGRWFRCDLYGLFDYLRAPGWKKVLAGRTVERSIYKSVLGRAQTDPDFPVKTARQAGEERLSLA